MFVRGLCFVGLDLVILCFNCCLVFCVCFGVVAGAVC